VLAEDNRPPVLYVRPFEREREYFVFGPKSKYGAYQIRFIDSRKIVYVSISLEHYLGRAIRKLVGPFVALGSPEDYLNPIGATRKYAKDNTWREDFDQLAGSAAAILVEVGSSHNISWELEHIREQGWQERVFVITRHPSVPGTGPTRRIADWIQRLKGIPDTSWLSFSENLAKLGYDVPSEDPGPGSVVTFTREAHGVVLTRGADLPDEYVEPIRARVARSRAASQ
jgi:hypothetical protein